MRVFPQRLPIDETTQILELELQLSDSRRLRLLRESDADELHALIDADRAYLSRFMAWAPSQNAEDTREFIRDTWRQITANNGLQTAIISGDEIIGVVGFHAVNWTHRTTSIGYWLGENHQGKGTMTLAVRTLIDHALDIWQLNRVEIRIATENRRSRAIPEHLGFIEEGTLRQAERIGDRYLDNVVYSILRGDWHPPN